jgi:hypothetical protein
LNALACPASEDSAGGGVGGVQPLLLDEFDKGHEVGGLRQLDVQLFHDRSEVLQELIERL